MVLGAASPTINGGCCGCFSVAMELRWATRIRTPNSKQFSIPVFISTKPSHVDPGSLRDLFFSCNRSCHAFPNVGSDGRVREEDVAGTDKLRVALDHSPVVVSVFCDPRDLPGSQEERTVGFGDLVRRVAPAVNPYDGKLVGFGRAVSDLGLTASIYDVMVIPSLQRMGIGRMIVQRIVRTLTGGDIYDIAALCSDNERTFFEACGFGSDILGSTTMMYTRTTGNATSGNHVVRRAGCKLLLVPTSKALKHPHRLEDH